MLSAAVQERMRELREKEAAAKADAEKMERLRIEGIQREVEAKSVEWEAELLFEIEKTPRFTTWLREKIKSATDPTKTVNRIIWHTPDGKQPFYKCGFRVMPDGERANIVIPHANMFETVDTIIAGIPVPAEYTLENERMRLRYRVLACVIASVKEAIRTEELVTQKRAAEEARVAAEEKAAAARAKEARKKIAIDLAVEEYSKTIVKTNKTPWHSFTGVDPTGRAVYVLYNETSKILRFEAKIFAFTDPDVKIVGQEYSPPESKAPASWNGLYEKGQLPFLTCCPVCSKQITLRCRRVDDWGHHAPDVVSVRCEENHYSWDPATNQHWRSGWPGKWDPRDPDGSIAARAARDKKIAELESQLEALRKT